MYVAYEDEDELLWSPGLLPESKVRSFLSEVLSRTTDEKTACDKPGIHVRDNEQVSNDLTILTLFNTNTGIAVDVCLSWPIFLFFVCTKTAL